ncbi:DHH family phosphoesterase [Dubosiella newyorkensis]|uniref:DHH family phosphoesterase n=1 Tax=Dubosiella newyorkensis TaxID=1862672 RepID=UPI0025730295|nr:DHH family phosphoesterase [Dubosiella newyorkensis]
MKYFTKWRNMMIGLSVLVICLFIFQILQKQWISSILLILIALLFIAIFISFWHAIKVRGVKTEFDISRILGKDAKDALKIGEVGIITYNDEFVATWTSDFFAQRDISLVNKKVTSWIENIRDIFDEDIDSVIGFDQGHVYEILKKEEAQVLYVHDITELYGLRKEQWENQVVVGLMQLDNYLEYQSYENEEIVSKINTHLRTPLISWAKEHHLLIRRIRSDRIFVLLNRDILETIRQENFNILQIIKDEANKIDVSITLSIAMAYGTNDYEYLDSMLNELMELAQSRGGDQAALQQAGHKVHYIGGNSETSSQRSKVRVRIMAQSIQEAMKECDRVFIAGHVNTDFDCMGAALAMSNWAKALKKQAFIILQNVPRDQQLQETMDFYKQAIHDRYTFITANKATDMIDSKKDLLIMVDHGMPNISSARELVDQFEKVIVIDHHRRNEHFVIHPLITYVESQASSTCELIVEMIDSLPNHIPVFEAEATILYLGLIIDTNRFKMHTSARTFDTAAVLRRWGANANLAEKALCEDFSNFRLKTELVARGEPYFGHFMIAAIDDKELDRTMMAQVSDSLLKIKGCTASFTIANTKNHSVAISARSDGTFNVQKIMEKMNGGGHFAAAALERKDTTVEKLKEELLDKIKEDLKKHESNIVERR